MRGVEHLTTMLADAQRLVGASRKNLTGMGLSFFHFELWRKKTAESSKENPAAIIDVLNCLLEVR